MIKDYKTLDAYDSLYVCQSFLNSYAYNNTLSHGVNIHEREEDFLLLLQNTTWGTASNGIEYKISDVLKRRWCLV
jgi:hypothetical protein